jgi:hypothetical protein
VVALLRKYAWLAMPFAIVAFGTAAFVGGSGHEHGGLESGHAMLPGQHAK